MHLWQHPVRCNASFCTIVSKMQASLAPKQHQTLGAHNTKTREEQNVHY